MNPRLVKNLIVGNLAVYAVVLALVLYGYFFPGTNSNHSAQDKFSNRAPFISIMLPTPTPYGDKGAPSVAGWIPTVVPLETPIPVTPSAPAAKAAPIKASLVRDQALVPPSAINVLLLGTDRRPGEINWRTDTIILLSINQEAKTVGMLTIPRDLYVNIPSIGMQRINTADFYGEYYHYPGGGPNLIKTTIERNLGIRVHYFLRGGFEGFRKAIDLVGGVDVDVDCQLYEQGFSDDFGYADLNFQPGVQTMDGVTALRYARSRYTTNDYDRGRRQRKVLLALWDKAMSLNLLPKWPQLWQEMSDSVQTDLGPVEMAALAFIGSQLKMDKITSRAIDNRVTTPWITPEGAQVLLPNAEKIHALLVDFFAPTSEQVDQVELEKAHVQIVSSNPQAAQIATVFVKRQGLDATASQDAAPYVGASTITVLNPKPATAERLASLLRVNPASVQMGAPSDSKYDIVVNLGRDYNACQK